MTDRCKNALRTSTLEYFPEAMDDMISGASRDVMASSCGDKRDLGIPWTDLVSVNEWDRAECMNSFGTEQNILFLFSKARCSHDMSALIVILSEHHIRLHQTTNSEGNG